MLYSHSAVASRGFLLRERGSRHSHTSQQAASTSLSLSFLEEEIHRLRLRMEVLFEQEQSLTSPHVVEASNELDIKINEYIKCNERIRKPEHRA
ncbi:aspartyl-phosphate phosphatase Spo0E family protein [Gorillibacterium sp. CAU 1737]|uniref:aspartyl-phosphate phosphatase Spo0E family protein n=1 Tax=Gorillibacterium sp. CAU 1737 TaxID=3140362 RepID=UPI003260F3EC